MESHVKSGQQVLVVWKQLVAGEMLKDCVESLQKRVGKSGKVFLENVERLVMSNHKQSTFDVILSGVVPQSIVIHNDELLVEYLRILKPNGLLVLHEPVLESGEHPIVKVSSQVTCSLKLSGFLNIDDHKYESTIDTTVQQQMKEDYNIITDFHMLEIICNKPNFEIGSSCLLNLKKVNPDENTAKIWSISSSEIIDDDIIDSDQLLDEEDFLKPDPATLKVCGTTGKRKACKNCSCGLADELADEKGASSNNERKATSACGNCYLGDAFRCASCPYMGLPPFKSGEKVTLTEQQLKADL
uniref:Anamorsin homolog n=1 Tax=Strigamia maritima TaxID=126957 RepID=T1J532_STRMM